MKVPNSVAEKVLQDLPVFCVNYKRECRQIFDEPEALEVHEKNCDYRLIQCPSSMCRDNKANYLTIPHNHWTEHSTLIV